MPTTAIGGTYPIFVSAHLTDHDSVHVETSFTVTVFDCATEEWEATAPSSSTADQEYTVNQPSTLTFTHQLFTLPTNAAFCVLAYDAPEADTYNWLSYNEGENKFSVSTVDDNDVGTYEIVVNVYDIGDTTKTIRGTINPRITVKIEKFSCATELDWSATKSPPIANIPQQVYSVG